MPPPPIDDLSLDDALPEEDYRRPEPHLEPVALPLGKVNSEPGEGVSQLFFQTAGIVSLRSW